MLKYNVMDYGNLGMILLNEVITSRHAFLKPFKCVCKDNYECLVKESRRMNICG